MSERIYQERSVLYIFTNNEKNLITELWEYFVDTYFSPEMPSLDNISFGTGTMISLRMILIGLTFGLIFASFITIYNKRFIGSLVRKLLKEECLSADSAKTLSELGVSKNPLIRFSLRGGSPLSRWVKCVEEDIFNAEMARKREEFDEAHKHEKKPPKFKEISFTRNAKKMHYYIPEEKKHAADIKFDAKGANWVSFILVAVISILLCAFLSFILPDMIKMIDNFISEMK